MNTRTHSRARAALPHRYRCQVEALDLRLPPGAILGPLGLAGWELGPVLPTYDTAETESSPARPAALLRVVAADEFDADALRADETGWFVRTPAAKQALTIGQELSTEFEAAAAAAPLPSAAALSSVMNAGAGGIERGSGFSLTPMEAAPARSGQAAEVDLLAQLLQAGLNQRPSRNLDTPQATPAYGQVPLSFEANVGQTDETVEFLSRGSGYTLFLTPTEAVLRLQRSSDAEAGDFGVPSAEGVVIRMEYVGANPDTTLSGGEVRPSTVNYFSGSDPAQWHRGVSSFARVAYSDLYDGIDLVWYSNANNQLEYDFIVAPGVDPSVIGMQFRGVDGLEVGDSGNLHLHTPFGMLQQERPFTYQEIGGIRREIPSQYTLTGDQVGFTVGSYDPTLPLVIDPIVGYATFLGGSSSEDGYAIAVDATGSAYVTGSTDSANFPATAGAYQTTNAGFQDVYVAKLSPDGSGLEYATYLGGSGNDRAHSIAVDGEGNAYVAGRSSSLNFPTTPGAFQTGQRGSTYDAFVTKLDPSGGALVYSTYLGGGGNDAAFGIAVDAVGQAVIAGGTNSEDFPSTPSAWQFFNQQTDSFLTRLSASGSTSDYSTYFGTSGSTERANGVAVDAAGMVYVVGQTRDLDFPTSPGVIQPLFAGGLNDGYLFKFDPNQSGEDSRVYATYLGGSDDDRVHGVALDAAGNVYLTGITGSADFTTANAFQPAFGGGATDAFVVKLDDTASTRVFATFLGGSGLERGNAIAVNAAGEAYVTGATSSADFPTLDPVQANLAGGADAFVTKFTAVGDALVYSTYYGGTGDENISFSDTTNQGGIALDGLGGVYFVGRTESPDFPTVNPLQPTYGGDSDAFVVKLNEAVPGVLACFTFSPETVSVAAGTPVTVAVNALDAFFNPVLDYTGEITFVSTDPAATLPPNYTYQLADMGVRTFVDGFIFQTPGLQYVTVFDAATFQIYGFLEVDVT